MDLFLESMDFKITFVAFLAVTKFEVSFLDNVLDLEKNAKEFFCDVNFCEAAFLPYVLRTFSCRMFCKWN